MTSGQWLVVALLVLACTAVIGLKHSDLPGTDRLAHALSFEHLAPHLKARVRHVLFTPVGALVVVWFRLTLGLRVLGPFRSVLLAIAFQMTGIPVGLAFFGLVIGVVVLLRPRLKKLQMPYFGRKSAMLVCVSAMVVVTMLVGEWLNIDSVVQAAFFPVVVLTLAGDAFAVTLRREGRVSALWRAGATAVAAVFITLLSEVPTFQRVMLSYPELILVVLAALIVSSKLLAFRWLQHLNPPPVKKKKKRSRALPGSTAATSRQDGVGEPAPVAKAEGLELPEVVG